MDGQIPELNRLEGYEPDLVNNTPDLSQSLAVRLLYERTLSACSRLLLLDTLKTGQALTKTLNELRLATDAGRVSVFRSWEEAGAGLRVRQVHEVCAPGVQPDTAPFLYNQPGFEPWLAALTQGEPIAGLVAGLPDDQRLPLEAQGILSILILPLWVEQRWYGFLCFEDKSRPRHWAEADIQLLQTAAELISAYLERKQAERTLRESEEKYRALIEQSSDAIYLIYGGRFEVINRRFEELFGVSREQANSPGFAFTNIIAPKNRAQATRFFNQALKSQLDVQPGSAKPRPRYEFTALDRNGQEIEVELVVSYPNYRGGLATQGVIRDITEDKHREQERRIAYQQAQQYAAELRDRIKEERRQHKIAASLAQVGASISLTLSPNELLAHILLKLQQLVEYDSASVFLVEGETLVRRAAGGFEQDVLDQRYPLADDLLFQVMLDSKSCLLVEDVRQDSRYRPRPGLEKVRCWVGAPLLVAREMIGYLAINHYQPGRFSQAEAELVQAFAHQVAQALYNARLFDDLKQTQARLIQRERLAALGQMASLLAHELRNPLMTIRTGIEYLLSDIPDTDPRRQSAHRLQRNMDRIDRIIEDILTVANTPRAALSPCFLQDLIQAEADRWGQRLAEKHIHVSIQPAPLLPPVLLDRDQIRRLISNLIANSVDALPEGGAISISLEQNSSRQVVCFADHGIGIPPENLPQIFEPFFTTKNRSTGLGLYLVRQVVELHGGSVTVESQPGQGARFTISFPPGED